MKLDELTIWNKIELPSGDWVPYFQEGRKIGYIKQTDYDFLTKDLKDIVRVHPTIGQSSKYLLKLHKRWKRQNK